jgi:hypothetical protein
MAAENLLVEGAMLIFGASMQGRHHLSLFKTESNNTIDPD